MGHHIVKEHLASWSPRVRLLMAGSCGDHLLGLGYARAAGKVCRLVIRPGRSLCLIGALFECPRRLAIRLYERGGSPCYPALREHNAGIWGPQLRRRVTDFSDNDVGCLLVAQA